MKIPAIKAVTIPKANEQNVIPTCKAAWWYGVDISVVIYGNWAAVGVNASTELDNAYDPTTAALSKPPSNPGIPWRLWTPQVSYSPVVLYKKGVRNWKPNVEIIPVVKPISNDPPGLIIKPDTAPITTPPERVAFSRCSIVNFDFKNALVMKVARQLPTRDMIVFVIIWVFAKDVFANTPKLNEGQYIHKKRVPMKAKIFEL